MPKTIASLADDFLSDPVKVAVAPVATTAERVEQQVMFVSSGHKQALLATVLRDPAIERVLVFTRTKHGADKVVRSLDQAGISAAAIHGNKSQPQRERALAAFRSGACRVLVATDIAARGIDVEAVTHVINFELPNVPESYVHRIGRTARAGAAGIAISFCNDEERAYLRDIERLTRQKVPVAPLPAGLAEIARSFVPVTDRAPSSEGRHRSPGRSAPGRGGSGRAAPGRSRQQPAQAASHGRDDDAAKKKQRRRRRPQQGGGGQQAHGNQQRDHGGAAPALPGFILNPGRDRRSDNRSGRQH
jgi:ATP-dependent RNA helicase RhlE